jgi:hypothetical protein
MNLIKIDGLNGSLITQIYRDVSLYLIEHFKGSEEMGCY